VGLAASASPTGGSQRLLGNDQRMLKTKWNRFVEKNMRYLKGLDASSDPIGSDEALG
jgi:hypothetical protein